MRVELQLLDKEGNAVDSCVMHMDGDQITALLNAGKVMYRQKIKPGILRIGVPAIVKDSIFLVDPDMDGLKGLNVILQEIDRSKIEELFGV